MVRNRKPVRGGKRKFDKSYERRPKPKKGKFNLKESSYVKERDAKNEAIERRRKLLEEQKARQQEREAESSDEEQIDPLKTLLSTFSDVSDLNKDAVDSGTESEGESEAGKTEGKEDAPEVPELDVSEDEEEVLEEDDREEIIVDVQDNDEEDAETAQEDAGHLEDPFSLHLRNDLDDDLYKAVSNTPQSLSVQKQNWPVLGNIICYLPRPEGIEKDKKKPKVSILEDKQFAKYGEVPSPIDSVDWNKLYVKLQIQNNLSKANHRNIERSVDTSPGPLTPLQKELFSVINDYQDLYFPERSFANAEEIRFLYCLHTINHVLKTRTKILHHNAKLSKLKGGDMSTVPDEYRDQGLVRPKVLIIVPFRHSCLKVVEMLIAILIGEDKGGSVMNKNRFMEDFSGNELAMPKKNPKPEDYELTFQGNTDDTFKIGIAITKKTLKLYTEFYNSDIIISSVLGLRMIVGAEGEAERDYDFLASLELLIMDQTELFFMQNWDHLIHIFNHLHLQPKNSHDTDFSRVRSWCVNGWAKYYRQTLIFSGIQLPDIHAILNKKCFNYAGKVKVVNPVSVGSICQVVVQVPQIFHRFGATSHSHALDCRLEFFKSKILPQYKDSIMYHTLIFVPSYYDFVKVRNYFRKEELSFVQICEYSRDGKVARARDMFYHSDAHFLIYSERFHFFRRIRLKGIRHLIFYAPPNFPQFYSEMCNLMQEANQNPKAGSESNMTVTILYSKYDSLQLAAIVGTERAAKMIGSDKSVHMLMTGE